MTNLCVRSDANRGIGCRRKLLCAATLLSVFLGACTGPRNDAWRENGGRNGAALYRSPVDAAFSGDGRRLAVVDETAACCYIIDMARPDSVSTVVKLRGAPSACVWLGTDSLVVTEYDNASVALVDVPAATVVRRIPVGPKPSGVARINGTGDVLVAGFGLGLLQRVDITEGCVVSSVDIGRYPCDVAVDSAGAVAVVTHLISTGPATDPLAAARVSIYDVKKGAVTSRIALPDGSTNARGVCLSPDGRWAYVAHTRGRPGLLTSQLDRGWISTNAISVIDIAARRYYAGLLLDSPGRGAADPWDIALGPGGRDIWVSLSGVHQVARIDGDAMHRLLRGEADTTDTAAFGSRRPHTGTANRLWAAVAADSSRRSTIVNHLNALSATPYLSRLDLPVRGPRGLAVSPKDGRVAVCGYFSGDVVVCGGESASSVARVNLGTQDNPAPPRRGEEAFHDGTRCFQQWLSCASCHPGGRADGLNWDLLNDGAGNPKNARSMVLSHATPPAMAHGVRASSDIAVLAGFRHIMFVRPEASVAADVQAYVASLQPERSPYLERDGRGRFRLSASATRGKVLFGEKQAGCGVCHPAPLYTDKQLHDVGTKGELDTDGEFDTPSLVELWRTAPYLHDGRASTVLDVITVHNEGNRRGNTSALSEPELADLAAFLLSL